VPMLRESRASGSIARDEVAFFGCSTVSNCDMLKVIRKAPETFSRPARLSG
jgi:hypothetical protein